MRMNLQPGKVLSGVWQGYMAKRQQEREAGRAKQEEGFERVRIERADRIKHALIVLEAVRSGTFEDGKLQV
jgi:hypothetical protein